MLVRLSFLDADVLAVIADPTPGADLRCEARGARKRKHRLSRR
jgi:hypothetical protein